MSARLPNGADAPMPQARTEAVLRRVAGQLGPYPFARELTTDAAASCYLGLVESTLARQGLAVSESDVFLFGGALELEFQQDEYGEPDLWFSIDATTRTCCEALGCTLDTVEFDASDFDAQLGVVLEDGLGAIVWTYSKHLAYTTDVYAQRGYIHSVLALGFDQARAMVAVLDRQVATTPHVSCVAELPLAQFRRAVTEIPWPEQYPGLDCYHRIRAASATAPSAAMRRAALLATARRILDPSKADPLRAFGDAVRSWLSEGPGELGARAESSNRVITTDHVLPSRRALGAALGSSDLAPHDAAKLLEHVGTAVRAWELAAAGLRRVARGSPPNPARWDDDVARVRAAETELWRAVEQVVSDPASRSRSGAG